MTENASAGPRKGLWQTCDLFPVVPPVPGSSRTHEHQRLSAPHPAPVVSGGGVCSYQWCMCSGLGRCVWVLSGQGARRGMCVRAGMGVRVVVESLRIRYQSAIDLLPILTAIRPGVGLASLLCSRFGLDSISIPSRFPLVHTGVLEVLSIRSRFDFGTPSIRSPVSLDSLGLDSLSNRSGVALM
jgi:hypothetical protein